MSGNNFPEKPAAELWQDYQFLTVEMEKLLVKQDMDLFLELMEQRERLQKLIEETNDQEFRTSPQGISLLTKIQQTEKTIMLRLQLTRNKANQQHQISRAYDSMGASPAGHFINRKS